MRIKDECKISISGRNKRRTILVGVILSIVTLLTPVSLAATAGISVNKITDQSVNTDKITSALLNPASSALILSILDKGKTTDQSANNVGTEIAGGSTVDTSGDSSNSAATNNVINTASGVNNNVIVNTAVGGSSTSGIGVSGSSTSGTGGSSSSNNQPQPDINNNVNQLSQVNPIGVLGSQPTAPSFDVNRDMKKGYICVWDAGYRYDLAGWRWVPGSLSGHAADYVGDFYKDINTTEILEGRIHYSRVKDDKYKYYAGNLIETSKLGVHFRTLDNSNCMGFHYFAYLEVNCTSKTQIEDVCWWLIDRLGEPYQQYWDLRYGPSKSCDPGSNIVGSRIVKNPKYNINNQWYCSELPWAAYYNITHLDLLKTHTDPKCKYTTAGDADQDGWAPDLIFDQFQDMPTDSRVYKWVSSVAVSPIDILHSPQYPNSTVRLVNWIDTPKEDIKSCDFINSRVFKEVTPDDFHEDFSADSNSNSNTASYYNSGDSTLSYSDSKDNTADSLNSVSSSNTLTSLSLSLNANSLLNYLLKIPRSH